ncbi:unnamed protein product [Cuscuta epithymum]|uniref:Secreted protein n=1 Tax=Cuscuta epithymum TaxID=186058 RepID=A0AAV0CC91_9ASTE|nr:unnamed protein product [Cuscuta epithymum]
MYMIRVLVCLLRMLHCLFMHDSCHMSFMHYHHFCLIRRHPAARALLFALGIPEVWLPELFGSVFVDSTSREEEHRGPQVCRGAAKLYREGNNFRSVVAVE